MDDVLLGIVLDRLDKHQLADEAADLLLAALDGDEALAAQLSAAPGERYSAPEATASERDPVGAYLSSITVKGFRGIGPPATLKVKEGPGLCRTAAESAFIEAYWRTELRRGRTRTEIEDSLEGNGRG